MTMKVLSVVRYVALCSLSLWAAMQAQSLSAQVIVAHRGASHDAPENTIAAFKEAWIQNADGIEGDFYVTRDQQIVCIHDANTERTAGRKLMVAQSTLAQLRDLEYGAWKDQKFAGEPIPTFAEVLAVIPDGKLFVVELKTGPEIVPLLKAELERLKPNYKDLLIIAFNQQTVSAVKRDLPEIRTHWLTGYRKDKQSGEWHPIFVSSANARTTHFGSGIFVCNRRRSPLRRSRTFFCRGHPEGLDFSGVSRAGPELFGASSTHAIAS